MSARLVLGLFAVVPPLLALACEPGSDGHDVDPAPTSSTGGQSGTMPFGSVCYGPRECAEGECYEIHDEYEAEGDTCQVSSCTGICTNKCTTDADCPANGRCTSSPRGLLCLARCEKNNDCPGNLTCARAGAEGVCWDPQQAGGEIKFRTELSIVSLNLKDRYELSDNEFASGAWRLVPSVPAYLSLGVLNTGSGFGQFTATVRPENEWIEVVYAGSALSVSPLKWESAGTPAPSGWAERILLKAKEGIPVGTPLLMTLVLVKEGGLEETAVPFNLTSFASSLNVEVTEIYAEAISVRTGNLNDPGYLLYIYGGGKGFGGAVISKARVVSGATEIPMPEQLRSMFYNGQVADEPFFGIEDPWRIGRAENVLLHPLAIAELPQGPITIELSERPENVWQATLPVTVQ